MVSQLSMMTKNAHRHLDNPAFIEDMLETVDHAVNKMQRILTHLKSAESSQALSRVDLCQLLPSIVDKLQTAPVPSFHSELAEAWVEAESAALSAAVMNLVVNAQEAVRTSPAYADALQAADALTTDLVTVTLAAYDSDQQAGNGHYLVTIADKGPGMSANFVQEKLFKPFNSTKGLTGMGIGLYQTKASIEALGGKCLWRA